MIVQSCSYEAEIKTPKNPSNYSQIVVTFAQNGTVIINKAKSSLTVGTDSVTVHLSGTETKQFDPLYIALMQIKCYTSTYEAPGSCVFGIQVCPALNDEVLS